MYKTCPKCRYKRQPTDIASDDECPRCGLIFSKWMDARFAVATRPVGESAGVATQLWERLIASVIYVPSRVDGGVFAGRVVIYIVFFVWGWSFILATMESNEIGRSFMHNIDLVFHEAGHVVFRPFGRFLMILGGSLGQLLMPAIAMLVLLWKNRDPFGASIGLWWLAQSMMDLAPYINDARSGSLMLLGGVTGSDMPGIHDWRNILSDLGMLQYDNRIARITDTFGEVLMLVAFVWGAYILFRQNKVRRRSA